MARRRRDLTETAESREAIDELVASRRYRWLGRYLMACEPDSPAEALHKQITAKRDRLDATGAPIAERLAKLEAFLADRGLLEQASAFADRRAKWATQTIKKGGRRGGR